MDADFQESIDDSIRIIAIGEAIMDEADDDPAFRRWLMRFLDARIDAPGDRERLGLPKRRRADVLPFPAPLPEAD